MASAAMAAAAERFLCRDQYCPQQLEVSRLRSLASSSVNTRALPKPIQCAR